MYAAIFGMFSVVWFGWAQEGPRESWRKYIGTASVMALLICLYGVYLSVRNWDAPSALREGASLNVYLISVYDEFILAAVGALVLIRKKIKQYVAPWIAFIVGIHFIPLKPVFDDASLYLLAALLVGVSILSLVVSPKLKVAHSAVTGIGAGIVLCIFSVLGLVRYYM